MPLRDFGYGRVLGHQHDNGGGWVADTAHVAPTVFVGPRAHVSYRARVFGNVRLEDKAIVADRARVSGNVIIRAYGGAGGIVRLGGNLVICECFILAEATTSVRAPTVIATNLNYRDAWSSLRSLGLKSRLNRSTGFTISGGRCYEIPNLC